MSFKGIVRELIEIKDGIGNLSRRRLEWKNWGSRNRSHIVPNQASPCEFVEQGLWANLPPELLLDIIRRIEVSETSWPARTVVVSCAAVCRSWREVTKEIVQTPELCGRLTFPISLKQPGPRDFPIQCFIKRDSATSTIRLYSGPTPSEDENDKLLLAARKIRRATTRDFVISLVVDDFSRTSSTYLGKMRSNFLGTKFTVYDSQPQPNAAVKTSSRSSRRFHSKRVFPRVPPCSYRIATLSYEVNVLRRGPRKLHCLMHSIPASAIQVPAGLQGKDRVTDFSSVSPPEPPPADGSRWPLVLENKAPRWHEQLQCWCLNFGGRVTMASVKNFQLVAAARPPPHHRNVPAPEQEKVILQFGKIGKDVFTMDYRYPLSAFQAFAICLSSFDTKPACE
ncbi:hypothetical protein Nepgr_025877 [Nepenthes gracilis]|uniref:Tubby-like F-box protein n=1 Tax=Nepenthes gracilis TaxID=150966 RepID=A0AAD3T7W3_NEPGR|nr:hypothetical protein Nepgr_025877 [Nepenthes gracilis]